MAASQQGVVASLEGEGMEIQVVVGGRWSNKDLRIAR